MAYMPVQIGDIIMAMTSASQSSSDFQSLIHGNRCQLFPGKFNEPKVASSNHLSDASKSTYEKAAPNVISKAAGNRFSLARLFKRSS